MKASKRRTGKKVFLNVMAALLVLLYAGNIIAAANASMVHGFLKTTPTRVELVEGAEDEGYVRYYESEYPSVADLKAAGNALVREVEGEGIVLLKNENNALPLPAGSDVALVGVTVLDPVYGGTGSGAVDAAGAPNYLTVMEGEGFNVVNKVLLDAYVESDAKRTSSEIGEKNWKWVERKAKNDDDELVIGNGEHVIYVVGRVGGEGSDMTGEVVEDTYNEEGDYLTLNDNERDILENLSELRMDEEIASLTVIINSANPISVGFLFEDDYAVDAALWVGSVGQTGLYAVGDVLTGRVNPSGSLPDTWWIDNQLNPVQNNFGVYTYEGAGDYNLGNRFDRYVVYQEGIYLGYKYTETRYEDAVLGTPNVGNYNWRDTVAYPFGYGLSYTTFEYSDFNVTKGNRTTTEYVSPMSSETERAAAAEREETVFNVTVTVTNTGDVAGKKTVQVYAQKPYTQYDIDNRIEKASAELVGYAKTQVLEPGASETVTVTVPEYFLTSYDAEGTGVYILSEGTHYLTVADDSHEAVNNILNVKGKTTADGMTSAGNPALVHAEEYTFDAEKYAAAYGTGETVKSLFDEADVNRYEGKGSNSVVYYSRNNWQGTVTPGHVRLTMTPEMAATAMLNAEDIPSDEGVEMPTMGEGSGLQLIHMMSYDFDAPEWEKFMDQLTFNEMAQLLATGLRMTYEVPSIGKPRTLDHNGPSGVTQAYNTPSGENGYATINNDANQSQKGTCFPCNGIVAATFNDELVYRVGKLIGEDAMWAGYAGLYGSGLNIHRSPYAGRVFEYYSEDGILTGLIDTYETRGIQEKGVYVYNKHFVLNDQEANRAGIATWCNEQALREIYLRAFELPIVNADAMCVMTAYNRLGAEWAGAYRELVTDWLRGEAGMRGFAVTDMYDPAYMVRVHEVLAGNDIPDFEAKDLSALSAYGPDGAEPNAVVVNRMRESAKRVLYTVLHSRGMDGISNNSIVVPVTAWWQQALNIGQIVFATLTAIGAVVLVVDIAKEKFGKAKAQQ